jgi:hypothetical protein
MSTFVLVHGAWHDGSAWNTVIQHLEARGQRTASCLSTYLLEQYLEKI